MSPRFDVLVGGHILRMSRPETTNFCLGEVSCSTHSITDFLDELHLLLEHRDLTPRTLLCTNAHIFNLAYNNPTLRKCLNEARINAADGIAIVWAIRWLGGSIKTRCSMTGALPAFLAADMPPSKAILIGCSSAEAEAAAQEINGRSAHCRVLGAYSGYLSDSEYDSIFRAHADIDLIFLGLGTPKTELLAQRAAQLCPAAVVWGIGGGTVRIYAGTLIEAPRLLRRLGLQWLGRLFREPRALWRRYLLGNPLFVFRILQTAWRTSNDPL